MEGGKTPKPKILLIDDDKWLTDLYGEKLQREGFSFFSASNGREGLKIISIYKPDLILLDVVMPKEDGLSVLKKIKSSPETQNIPVLMLTNLDNKTDKEYCVQLGADDYLVKVYYTPSEVLQKIKEYLKLKV